MYSSLLPKQQIQIITRRLIQHHQISKIVTLSKVPALPTSAQGGAWSERSTSLRSEQQNLEHIWTLQRKYHSGKTQLKDKATESTGNANEGHENAKIGQNEMVEDVDVELCEHSLKHLLYNDAEDALLKRLNQCETQQELLAVLEQSESELQTQHRVQAIMLMWAFHSHETNDKVLLQQPQMLRLLETLAMRVPDLNLNELSCCYLYLRKIGAANTQPLLQDLLMHALDIVNSSAVEELKLEDPLPTLSRLLVAINIGYDFHTPTVCRNFMQHLLPLISSCSSAEEARLLAICLSKLQALVDAEVLNMFKERVEALQRTGVLGSRQPRAIIKLLYMFNLPRWSQQCVPLLRDLMLALGPAVSNCQMTAVEVQQVCRIYQHHLEPAALTQTLAAATQRMLQGRTITPDVLACAMPLTGPQKREPLIAHFNKLLVQQDNWALPNASRNFFTVLRGLKIADIKACDTYWAGVMRELDNSSNEDSDLMQLRFVRHSHRYMNFNNNLGGTYRNLALERKLCALSMHTIEQTVVGRVPTRFARVVSFVLAYGHTPQSWKKFPNLLLSRIICMAPQFSIVDCLNISRGLQIAVELRFRQHVPPVLGMQLATIDAILLDCTERHLNNPAGLSVGDLNIIVRAMNIRKTLKTTVMFHNAMQKYQELDYSNLNSRTVRDMAYNFNSANFIIPKVLEAMFDYVLHNVEHIMGDTVEKILSCAYNLGYTPQSLDVLHCAAQILMRDFNQMSGLSLVQACLALCYYKTIPEELINKVFCVGFIQRIEEEIQLCYSKATYPERVLNLVMQLNRTVCLDFPEANVPWFQQNYLEAHLSKKYPAESRFGEDVKNLLSKILENETYFRCNHTTPYGYQIDFVIHFDSDRKPIAAPAETAMLDRITKVAILLLKLDSFCDNDLTTLRGPESLKMKHLEMMGYKVLHVNEHDWNSKYMKVAGAKSNYLKCLLQISS